MTHDYDIVIIGGGILGTSISYFLSFLNKSKKIAVIEQADKVAAHTSGRNTGKVHAPYLYNPEKKKLFATSITLCLIKYRFENSRIVATSTCITHPEKSFFFKFLIFCKPLSNFYSGLSRG